MVRSMGKSREVLQNHRSSSLGPVRMEVAYHNTNSIPVNRNECVHMINLDLGKAGYLSYHISTYFFVMHF